MQRGRSVFVEGIWIGARFYETGDSRRLCVWIPCARPGRAIDGVMKGLGPTAIPRANIGPHGYQFPRDLFPVGGGRDVQCGVARIYVVPDLIDVIRLRYLASRSILEMGFHQSWLCCEQSKYNCIVGSDDRPDQPPQFSVGHIRGVNCNL